MATSKNKKGPWLTGTKSGTVYYRLNDIQVARGIGINNKKATLPQQTVRQATRVTSCFLTDVMAYVNIGFEALGKKTRTNQQNQAFSYNRKNAVSGIYPNVKIDFNKVLLSIGTKPLPQHISFAVSNEGIVVKWNTDVNLKDAFWDDQVIMIAYFPVLRTSVFLGGGTMRYKGTEIVPLVGIKKGNVMHVYFSIIANNRKTISNSTYLGEMTW